MLFSKKSTFLGEYQTAGKYSFPVVNICLILMESLAEKIVTGTFLVGEVGTE